MCAGPVVLQVVCPYRCIEERAMPLKQMGDLGQVRKCDVGAGATRPNLANT